jgi:hypothetical protein
MSLSVNLFRSADGRFCARVPGGDRIETYGLKSAAFRDWLIDRLFGNELRLIALKLRLHGLSVTFEQTRDARVVTLKSQPKTTS